MSRTISVSTDVFASIWAQRHEGEETEDAILRRILGCEPASAAPANASGAQSEVGYVDSRNGVTFPKGFTIVRTYKRKEYSAVAEDGHWRRADNGQTYGSLNQLNASIAAGNENVWNGNWKFRADDGTLQPLDALRRAA